MILEQDPDTGYWTKGSDFRLVFVHSPAECQDRGCAIHNHPTDHPLKDAPLNWREDRSILERICKHGVGHPDRDAALYLSSLGLGYRNTHGCCGCC